jgi:formylglycine-generating enzyme required for sulfatase activity
LGDVEGEDYEFGLAVPSSSSRTTADQASFSLGDPELEARLQRALDVLAIRQGDRQALDEVEVVLDEALRRANGRMDRGDLEGARSLLNAVRQVQPDKDGLSESWDRLVALQQVNGTSHGGADAGASAPVTTTGTYALPSAAQAERLDQLLSTIAARPGNQAAFTELDRLLDDVLAQARAALADGDIETAGQLIAVVQSVNPRKRGLGDARRLLRQGVEVADWNARALEAESRGALIEPRTESAYYWYRRSLSADPTNEPARQGMARVQRVMIQNALDAAANFDFELADAWLDEAAGVLDNTAVVDGARRQVNAVRDEAAAEIEARILTAIRAGDYNLAEFTLIDLIALGGYEDRVVELRSLMTREAVYGQYQPGDTIRDQFTDGSRYAPVVVVVSSGSFVMGSRENERERTEAEGPQHRVTFARGFALGQREVTVGEFAAFVADTGYRTRAERDGGSSAWDEELGQLAERPEINWRHDYAGAQAAEDLPVLHVSWEDATAFVQWLSAQTGRSFRLPSEAEFEYALRAGTRSVYWWGDGRPLETVENLAGENDRSPTGRRFSNQFRGYGDDHFGPAPAGSFAPNPWGLHDLAGNVAEWTQDCWHSSYVRAPDNGLPWENPGCARRVIRGGYWASAPRQVRSASRVSAPPNLRTPQVGFRVARDLW